jgi:hypothetical protein
MGDCPLPCLITIWDANSVVAHPTMGYHGYIMGHPTIIVGYILFIMVNINGYSMVNDG